MKLTKQTLKQIIKEELENAIQESLYRDNIVSTQELDEYRKEYMDEIHTTNRKIRDKYIKKLKQDIVGAKLKGLMHRRHGVGPLNPYASPGAEDGYIHPADPEQKHTQVDATIIGITPGDGTIGYDVHIEYVPPENEETGEKIRDVINHSSKHFNNKYPTVGTYHYKKERDREINRRLSGFGDEPEPAKSLPAVNNKKKKGFFQRMKKSKPKALPASSSDKSPNELKE